jgi:hypothetical protein
MQGVEPRATVVLSDMEAIGTARAVSQKVQSSGKSQSDNKRAGRWRMIICIRYSSREVEGK